MPSFVSTVTSRIGRNDVREEAMALLDPVVVVRHRVAGLDHSVLGSSLVRRDATREPGGVEAELVLVALGGQRCDVAVAPVPGTRQRAASSSEALVTYRAAKITAADGRNRCDDGQHDLGRAHGRTPLPDSTPHGRHASVGEDRHDDARASPDEHGSGHRRGPEAVAHERRAPRRDRRTADRR